MQFGLKIIVAAQRHTGNLVPRLGRRRLLAERRNHIAILAGRFDAILAQDGAQDVQPVDDAKDSGDERRIGLAIAAPHLIERIFGGVRQRSDPRQRQKARTALDRVDEPENGVELRPVGRIGFPRHQCPASFGQDFRRFGQKIVQQIVYHGTGAPQKLKQHHGR